MKKLLVIALCLVMLFTFSACSGAQFLSQSKVDKLVEKYSENGKLPQVEMTLTYKSSKNSTPMQIKVVYNLLLDKAPISVISFINLLNSGRYNNAVVDGKYSTYMEIGRFTYEVPENDGTTDSDGKLPGTDLTPDTAEAERLYLFAKTMGTFAGEFKNNNFSPYGKVDEGDDGYTKFQLFSLAMWHDTPATKSDDKEQQAEYKRAYNSANGRLLLSLGSTDKGEAPNYKDYAVFAHPVSFSVSYDGGANFQPAVSLLDAPLLNQLKAIASKTITINGTKYNPLQIDVSFQMVAGNIDWANITENYLVEAE